MSGLSNGAQGSNIALALKTETKIISRQKTILSNEFEVCQTFMIYFSFPTTSPRTLALNLPHLELSLESHFLGSGPSLATKPTSLISTVVWMTSYPTPSTLRRGATAEVRTAWSPL